MVDNDSSNKIQDNISFETMKVNCNKNLGKQSSKSQY